MACDYWVYPIDPTTILNEWRIHVFMGRVIARGLKVLTGKPWRKLPIKSRNNGWTLRHDINPSDEIKDAARRVVEACGYDFGAADIVETTTGPVALEVNTAPSVKSDYTSASYVKALLKCASGKWTTWKPAKANVQI
jgi:hypothetical protein